MKYILILIVVITNVVNTFGQGNNTLLVDDFSGIHLKNLFNNYWYEYTDKANNGNSVLKFYYETEATNKVLRVDYKLNKGACPLHAYVVLSCPIKPETVDTADFNGIAYDYKGDGHTFTYRLSVVRDYAFHKKNVAYSEDWTTVVIPFSELKQTWGDPVPFNKNLIENLQWEVESYSTDTGYFQIDNIRLVKDINKFKAEVKRTAPHYNLDTTFSAEAVKNDIIAFKNGLEEVHPNLYRYISKKALDSLFNLTLNSINKPLTVSQAILKIKPIKIAIKDGFDVALPSKYLAELENNKLFPFDIKIFNGKLYIYNNYTSDTTIKKGDLIVSINNQPASDIVKNMLVQCTNAGNIASKSKYYVEWAFNTLFPTLYGLSDSYQLEFKNSKGEVLNKKVQGISADKIEYYHNNRNKKSDFEPYKLSFDKKKSIATLKISSFRDEDLYNDKYKFFKFLKASFEEIKQKKIKNLILDLRYCDGGNGFSALELMKYVSVKDFHFLDSLRLKINNKPSFFNGKNPIKIGSNLVKRATGYYGYEGLIKNYENESPITPYKSHFTGKIYVLTNGASYNPFMLNVVLKEQPKVVFIGDESISERLELSGYGAPLVLPHTKIITYIPIQNYYYSKPENEIYQIGRGLMPDYEMQEDLESFLIGKDNIMDFTLDLINKPTK